MNIKENILNEYKLIREKNNLIYEKKIEEIYNKIPEIKKLEIFIANNIQNSMLKVFEMNENDFKTLEDFLLKANNKKRILLEKNGYSIEDLEPIYDCTICKDTGFYNFSTCICYQKKVIEQNIILSNLQNKIKKYSFQAFNLDIFSDIPEKNYNITPRDNIIEIKNLSNIFINSFSKTNKYYNLYFHGGTGVGKTFMACCIANELLKKEYTVLYLQTEDMMNLIKKYSTDYSQENETIYYSIKNVDLLIIDDLGSEYITEFTKVQLFNLLNERIENEKKMIIISNYKNNNLKGIYNEKIESRLNANYFISIEFIGNDLRGYIN